MFHFSCRTSVRLAARKSALGQLNSRIARFNTAAPASKITVLLIGSADTAVMQRVRTRLAVDVSIELAVELAASASNLAAALRIHSPQLVLCMDDRAAKLMPASALRSQTSPCLVVSSPLGNAQTVLLQQHDDDGGTGELAPEAVLGPVWARKDIGARSSSRSHWYRHTVGDAVAASVLEVVHKQRHGMGGPVEPSQHATLIKYNDAALNEQLGPLDFTRAAHDVVARIQATGAHAIHPLCSRSHVEHAVAVICL